jgi:hypothetical protein
MASHKESKATWWNQNWKWFLPVLCFCGVLALGFIALIVFLVSGMMKSSDAYQLPVAAAKTDARVIKAIGSPVEEGFFPTGAISTAGSSGHANLSIRLSGPKGRGTIYVLADRAMNAWNFSNLVFVVEGTSDRIHLNVKPVSVNHSHDFHP